MKKMKLVIVFLCALIAVSTGSLFAQTTVHYSKLAKTLEKNKKNGAEFISEISLYQMLYQISIEKDGTVFIPRLATTVSIVLDIDSEYLEERIERSEKKTFILTFVAKDMKAYPKLYEVTKIDGIETVEEYKSWKELEEQRNANEAAGFGRVTNAERAALEAERAALEAALEAELVANKAAGFGRVTNEERQFLEQEKADFFENPEKYFNMTVNANNTVSITGLKEEAAHSLHCIYIPGDISGIPIVDVEVEYDGREGEELRNAWGGLEHEWIPSSIVFLDVPSSVKSLKAKIGSLKTINIAKNSQLEEIFLDGTHRNHEEKGVLSTNIDANFENISKEFSLKINGYKIDKFTLPKKCKEFIGGRSKDKYKRQPLCAIGTLTIDSSVKKLTISAGSEYNSLHIEKITTSETANKNLKELIILEETQCDTLDISNSAIETLTLEDYNYRDKHIDVDDPTKYAASKHEFEISLPASIKRIIKTSSNFTGIDTIHIPESVKQIVFWLNWRTYNGRIIDEACPKDWWMFSTSSTKTQIELRRVGYIGRF